MKVNAVVEPTWHDNAVRDADQLANDGSDEKWIGYDEREHITVADALAWAGGLPWMVTLFLYDETDGIYPVREEKVAGAVGLEPTSSLLESEAQPLDHTPEMLNGYVLQKMEPVECRVETGPMQFGDDWPGVFIRGDEAIAQTYGIAHALSTLKEHPAKLSIRGHMLVGLGFLLASCNVGNTGWPPRVPVWPPRAAAREGDDEEEAGVSQPGAGPGGS